MQQDRLFLLDVRNQLNNVTRAQAQYVEEPKDLTPHLVRKRNSPLDKVGRWAQGFRVEETLQIDLATLSVLTLSWVPVFFSEQSVQLRGGIHFRHCYFLSGNHHCLTQKMLVLDTILKYLCQ